MLRWCYFQFWIRFRQWRLAELHHRKRRQVSQLAWRPLTDLVLLATNAHTQMPENRDSSAVRMPGLVIHWKVAGPFESRQERRDWEFSSPGSTFCANFSSISVSVAPPCYRAVIVPAELQVAQWPRLNVALHKVTWHSARLHGVHRTCRLRRQQFHVAPAM